jgi:hypothetical protein
MLVAVSTEFKSDVSTIRLYKNTFILESKSDI